MLMLSWPSWEERRKRGEGRIEDSRPSQAKNAIAPVVGAGRPLCLDKTGLGGTEDEPRNHWHLLADRLVTSARQEVPGPTGRRLPIPRQVLGTRVHFMGVILSCCRGPHCTPLPGRPAPHLRALFVAPEAWPLAFSFFLCAPAGPSLPRERWNSISNFHSPLPPPISSPLVDLSRSLQQRAGGRSSFFSGGVRYPANGALQPRPGGEP